MPFFASPFKVTHNPSGTPFVLLDVDAYLTGWPEMTGGHLVSEVDRVKAAGRKPFARQNEFSTIDLAWLKEYPNPDQAFAAWLGFASSIPRSRATIRFTGEGGALYNITDGMFKNWNARQEGHIVYFTIQITGGVLAAA